MCCCPCSLPLLQELGEPAFAHAGMVSAAQAIFEDMSERGILQQVGGRAVGRVVGRPGCLACCLAAAVMPLFHAGARGRVAADCARAQPGGGGSGAGIPQAAWGVSRPQVHRLQLPRGVGQQEPSPRFEQVCDHRQVGRTAELHWSMWLANRLHVLPVISALEA